MEKYVQQIYCDESGTTGPNLMHPGQLVFSYASIAISNEEAMECVARTITNFGVQGGELKSKNLLGHHRGRKAITRILEEHHDRFLVSVFDKRFSLACKLFEYCFESALTPSSSIFYAAEFHRFVANALYLHFKAGIGLAEAIFEEFEKTMRSLDGESRPYLFGTVFLSKSEPILDLIRRFCYSNRQAVQEELESLRGHGAGKWILDLTTTALFSHLGTWGDKYHQLEVYCDQTKALEGFEDFTRVMIDREDKVRTSFHSREQPITFNLAKDISLVNSFSCPGVQLADVAAGATVYAFQNADDSEAKKWKEYLPAMLHPTSVLPDVRHLDMSAIPAQRNLALLQELVRRSESGLSLTEGIDTFLVGVTSWLDSRRPHLVPPQDSFL